MYSLNAQAARQPTGVIALLILSAAMVLHQPPKRSQIANLGDRVTERKVGVLLHGSQRDGMSNAGGADLHTCPASVVRSQLQVEYLVPLRTTDDGLLGTAKILAAARVHGNHFANI